MNSNSKIPEHFRLNVDEDGNVSTSVSSSVGGEASSGESAVYIGGTDGQVSLVTSQVWSTVGSVLYPGAQLNTQRPDYDLKEAWVLASAGSSQDGVEVQLIDSQNRVIAGPTLTFASSNTLQLFRLLPLDTSKLRRSAFAPQPLYLQARNKYAMHGSPQTGASLPPSQVGALLLVVDK